MIPEVGSDGDFEARLARVEHLLADLSKCADPRVERVTREVLTTMLELHQRGLSRMLSACDERMKRDFAHDTDVSAMLLLHGLHPLALDSRVSRVVDRLRARFNGKIADVTMNVSDGRITLRVVPVSGSCGSTRAGLKAEFEEALLSAAPDAESVSVELAEPPPALVTLRLRRSQDGEQINGGPR